MNASGSARCGASGLLSSFLEPAVANTCYYELYLAQVVIAYRTLQITASNFTSTTQLVLIIGKNYPPPEKLDRSTERRRFFLSYAHVKYNFEEVYRMEFNSFVLDLV